MKDFVYQLSLIYPFLEKAILLIVLIVKWKDVYGFLKEMLSEKDLGLSSKRGVAFGAALTLFHVCIKYYAVVHWAVLVTLAVIIILCLAIATFPQILSGIGVLKGFIQPPAIDKVDDNNKDEPKTP